LTKQVENTFIWRKITLCYSLTDELVYIFRRQCNVLLVVARKVVEGSNHLEVFRLGIS